MNTITKAALIAAAISLPALSASVYSHQQGGNSGGMMMNPKMMGQHMTNMRGRMQENHALMEKIMAEENAEKRRQMMQEHMQSMREQMQGMNGMMGDQPASGSPSTDMNRRMDMMDMRMNMMQMMMEQMMEHQGQAQ